MAILPVTVTRQWYSYANVPFTPANSTDVQQWMLWLWKELLIGNYTGKGGTEGPEGSRPATSYWTVLRSSDGAGNVSNSDLWVSRTNVIRATAGTNHSWIVLKSPDSGNPNGALGFGQGPMYMCIDNSAGVDARARILYARDNFSTGGTATARPTSTTEFEGAYFLASNVAPNIWTDANYGFIRYMSIAVDANGQFYLYLARSGSGTIESLSCCVENINSDDRDLYRQIASTCYFGHPHAFVQRSWTGGVRAAAIANASEHSTSGGMVRWNFGGMGPYNSGSPGTALSGGINGMTYTTGMLAGGFATSPTTPGFNINQFGQLNNVDANNYVIALPVYFLDYGSGYFHFHSIQYSSITNNRPEWRGQIPDAWAIIQRTVGSSYPSASNQTHVVAPNRLGYECCYLTPMSVQLVL